MQTELIKLVLQWCLLCLLLSPNHLRLACIYGQELKKQKERERERKKITERENKRKKERKREKERKEQREKEKR